MLPDSKFGNTKTLASPFISESGAFFAATLGTNAASNWNSPSIISLGFISLAFAIASTTRSVSSDWADPLVEKLSIATFGSIPKTFAVLLLSTAISAKSSLVGAILIAQSPKTRSEERRVGKEYRHRSNAENDKKERSSTAAHAARTENR